MTPRIALVLPRNTFFAPERATSVDLCVRDLVRHSRFSASTRVLCDWVEQPFEDVRVVPIRYDKRAGNRGRISELIRTLRADPPDLVVVHQHLPSAARIMETLAAPVLLHTHNFLKRSQNLFGQMQRRRDYARLRGMIFVSHACQHGFEESYPANATAKAVIENGLDMQTWRADTPSRDVIVVVGRAMPEKGMLEAMQALAATLPAHPGWRASFILSESEKHKDYFAALVEIATGSGARIEIVEKLPYAQVQARYEEAAIALVPSKWREPFGRTALEAHAGGAALISSGTGGLKEISGAHALYADPEDQPALRAALTTLIQDQPRRAELAKAGRARVAALYDVRALAAKLDEFYEQALTQAGGGR